MAYKIAFCGTPEFAVPALAALQNHPEFEVVKVFSQPDRPSGRGKKLKPSPVKMAAEGFSIPVETPERVSTSEIVDEIKGGEYDLGVVVAYGQILSQDFLDAFKHGCVNVHSSLLPRWRGAAPMQRALMAGDQETGVSLQKVVKKLDAGDVIAEHKLSVPIEMGAMELYTTLSKLGAILLTENLIPFMNNQIELRPQNEADVTHAGKIMKDEGLINWDLENQIIHNKIRGLDMGGPFAFTNFKSKTLKIHKSLPLEGERRAEPGVIVEVGSESFKVACRKGELEIFMVQPESKARMKSADFIRGYHVKEGEHFE